MLGFSFFIYTLQKKQRVIYSYCVVIPCSVSVGIVDQSLDVGLEFYDLGYWSWVFVLPTSLALSLMSHSRCMSRWENILKVTRKYTQITSRIQLSAFSLHKQEKQETSGRAFVGMWANYWTAHAWSQNSTHHITVLYYHELLLNMTQNMKHAYLRSCNTHNARMQCTGNRKQRKSFDTNNKGKG